MGTDLINIEKETLYKYYVTDMLSARGIARIYHCTGTTINNKLYKYGIIQNLTEAQRLAISNKRLEERTIAKNQPKSKLKQSISMKKAYERQPELKDLHRNNMLERFKDEDYKEETIAKLNAGLNASWESEEGRAKRVAIRNSDEYKEKWGASIRETWKNNPELAQNLSERDKLMWKIPEFRDAVRSGLDAYWSVEENRQKQSLMMIELWETPEFRDSIIKSFTIAFAKPEYREKLSKLLFERWSNPEYKTRMIKVFQDLNREHPELVVNRIEGLSKTWEDPVYRTRILNGLMENRAKAWADLDKRNIWVHNILKGSCKRPTTEEQIMIDVIEEFNLPYKYVGDGGFPLVGKNPDFVDTQGWNFVLEMNGLHWHNPDDVPACIALFAEHGYKTLILWDYEIKKRPHEEIRDKIVTFTNKCLEEVKQ